MNLAGNQAKNLFKSIRTGNPPSIVGMWAAATVVDQIRRRKRPEKELLLRKKLKPGQARSGSCAITPTVSGSLATVPAA